MKFSPFCDGDIHTALDSIVKKTCSEIDQLDNDYVLKASTSELEQHFIDKVIIEPLVLRVDDQFIEDKRTIQIDVSHDFNRAVFPGEKAHVAGTQLNIAIPFEGMHELWKLRPSTFSTSGHPNILLQTEQIILTFSFPDDTVNQEQLKKDIEHSIYSLVEVVNDQQKEIELHNRTAPEKIMSKLKSKKDKAVAATGVILGLGIPIKRKNQPAAYTAPVSRRPKIVNSRPKVDTETYAPEPVLDDKEYNHILSVLMSMSLVIERNSKSFSTLDEESIRDHFLIQLNGHYDGAATGETFNSSGKTDILIREKDRNIFIAECKFWRGSKSFEAAIDQLLSYLTWRDCKCALMVFNRNLDSTSVMQQMHDIMKSRKEWRKTLPSELENGRKYVFIKESEPGREIIITAIMFDVPKAL